MFLFPSDVLVIEHTSFLDLCQIDIIEGDTIVSPPWV